MELTREKVKQIIEATLLAAGSPLTIKQLARIFSQDEICQTTVLVHSEDDEPPESAKIINNIENKQLKAILNELSYEYKERGIELKEVASGYRFQIKKEFASWIKKLWDEKPPRYSRALLETLALIAYKQPITRAEIEAVRGVSVSSNIMRTLMEREWVKIAGHKEVPGRPGLYVTTNKFMDYFNIKTLSELPALQELPNFEKITTQLELELESENEDIEPQVQEENIPPVVQENEA